MKTKERKKHELNVSQINIKQQIINIFKALNLIRKTHYLIICI